jgi:peroxiredoxin
MIGKVHEVRFEVSIVCKSRFDYVVSAVAILAAFVASNLASEPKAVSIGASIPDFTAKDSRGRSHSLSEIGRDKVVVLVFVGVECPLAQLYAPRLVELASKYEPAGVVFLGIDSNRQDSNSEIGAYAQKHALSFPVLKDLRQRIANLVGATRTPQVVVLDRDRRIRYRGRIDDQFGFLPNDQRPSYRRAAPTRHDVVVALDSVLGHEPVLQPETAVAGCLIGGDLDPVAKPKVTYSSDVAPIVNKHCVVCHRKGELAPFALTTFDEVAGWAAMIAEVTQTNRMPPWHADERHGKFANDPRLSDAEKHVLAKWVELGAPEGDPSDLLPPPHFADGWMIPEPDEILYMSEQPFDVPADGVVELKNFIVDPGWKEDRWITAIEARPGNRSVVHHILIVVVPPEGRPAVLVGENDFLSVYAPGAHEEPLPKGLARFVKAGSKLAFNVHYTPNGSPQRDRSYVGIKFADPNSVQKELVVSSASNQNFKIPPAVAHYEVRSQYVFQRDSLLFAFFPHMHFRGTDFLYEAAYPDGRRELLLSVPRYDFNWQIVYRLAEPKPIPNGTVLNCVAHFDNSENNLNNPNPNAAVVWGEQIFDEMMIGFFEAAAINDHVVREKRLLGALDVKSSGEDLLVIALTALNLGIVCVLVFRKMSAKRA